MENRIKEQQLDLFADRTSCYEYGRISLDFCYQVQWNDYWVKKAA